MVCFITSPGLLADVLERHKHMELLLELKSRKRVNFNLIEQFQGQDSQRPVVTFQPLTQQVFKLPIINKGMNYEAGAGPEAG